MQIDIIKCHGSGNDFLLIDELSNDYVFTEEQRAELAKALCERSSELGADGILYVMPSKHADARMRVFNADGSEASMCGNGLRCVARYVCELQKKSSAVIETMKVNLSVNKMDDLFAHVPTYQVEISPVSFALKDLPLNLPQESLHHEKIPALSDQLRFTALAVPNPHLVAIVEAEQIHSDLQKHLSERVNGPNDLFPDGVNVSFVTALEDGAIYVRTFERGVGFTNACGTAMSASSLVTYLNGLNDKEKSIEVYNNGGKVHCIIHEQNGNYSIDLIGNATYVYKTKVNFNWNAVDHFQTGPKEFFKEESTHYEKLQEHVKDYLSKYI
ncbi:diaminopimelate epimerase [Bacillus canaveralius]|uniref:Diaminopimelate epimerase n=1 Tax=Bacillus canaveralius TaxID=1403243 RepID=A0A2N5GIW8_9BACI|nr:diaminopimelate epimerase [Bacillus canaveralius]PLR81005.1 diaminopimelate epimerase [Bacillus canaveralius]PLR99019.1 diaminopimelate epimerase [Bacillus canaveralius]RSK51780.1 diaminopimelate epimerase [Bacillus canaveralius]